MLPDTTLVKVQKTDERTMEINDEWSESHSLMEPQRYRGRRGGGRRKNIRKVSSAPKLITFSIRSSASQSSLHIISYTYRAIPADQITAIMQFTITIQALATLLINVALAAAAPGAQTAPGSSLVQNLDTRSAPAEDLLFGRSIPCASNDPSICCAVSTAL